MKGIVHFTYHMHDPLSVQNTISYCYYNGMQEKCLNVDHEHF